MFSIAQYQINETIYEGDKTLIFRATEDVSGAPVLIKTLKAEYPPLSDVVRIKREYEIAARVASDGVVRPVELVPYKNGYALVMEDLGGVSLHQHLAGGPLEPGAFLEMAISLADALMQMHRGHVIHKDIKPHNIIVSADRGRVQITDFGIASLLSSERQEMLNPNQLEGTLPYMSPEQTGRMNRMIDYRTDFYSLGVTFYEMLSGELPFATNDPVELIHSHIARQPIPLWERNPAVPRVLSDIVERCLAKNAEDRYQSAFGLKHDLEACRSLLLAGASTMERETLVIGQADKSEIFKIPEKLYGRDDDVELLKTLFDRASQGRSEMLLVSGFSGIGKSFLVHEIDRSVARENGFFVTGKFDQFKRHLPYSGLIQALSQLIHQLLTVSESTIAQWREKMLQAVGPNGQVLLDVLPDLELIIGKQPPVTKLQPIEMQNRFQLAMAKFIGVFTKREHPLVLFLDDLQWADLPSLHLIEYLLSDPATAHLLFIGAYRDNEVTAAHRLPGLIDDLRKKQVEVQEISLTPLGFSQVGQLIADTMQCLPEEATELTELVMEKTKGNPFFVKQFLRSLHAQELVRFDAAALRWQWHLEPIRELGITDNVVDFMLNKVRELPSHTQEALRVAACIGNRFDVRLLSMVLERDLMQTARDLWEALQQGLLVPIGTSYKLLYSGERQSAPGDAAADAVNASFKFLHDRVQQVAYALLTDDLRQAVHVKIGRWLLEQESSGEAETSIFHVVNHLNEGVALITDPSEREKLAALNLTAGRRAKAATAYEPALKYLAQGVALLADDGWQSQYRLTFDLHQEQTEVEYLCGHYDDAERNFDLLLGRAKTVLEKGHVFNIRTILHATRGRYAEAVQTGLEAAELLGVKIPRPTKLAVGRELVRAKLGMRKRVIEDLVNLPLLTEPQISEAMKILLNIAGAAYMVDQNLFILLNLRIFNLTLRYGNSIASGLSYGGYGIMLGSGFGDYPSGYRFGELALKVDDVFDELFAEEIGNLKAKGYFGHACMIMPWVLPIRDCFSHLRNAYQQALDSGDLIYATYSAAHLLNFLTVGGVALPDVLQEAERYLDFVNHAQVEDFTANFLVLRNFAACLLGQTDGPLSLDDAQFAEADHVAKCAENQALRQQSWYFLVKMMLLYVMEEQEQALEMALESDRSISAAMAQIQGPEHALFYTLVLAANFEAAPPAERKQYAKTMRTQIKKLKKWSVHAPENFGHRHLLAAAEYARVTGDDRQAPLLYDQAIRAAAENGYTQIVALANECAGRYYLATGREKIARTYLTEARYHYLVWGALGKVKQLDQKYPHGLIQMVQESRLEVASTTTVLATTDQTVQSIDLLSVLKAAQTISGEIVLDKLLANMIHIVVENAGAQKGFLLFLRGDELLIEAEKHLEGQTVRVLHAEPFAERDDLSSTIIHYVRRTREDVVLHDASLSATFAKDPYIREHAPKSILCLPVVNQGRLVGVLYLENNLTTHAFTKDRFEVMKLLASQIAVSMENAQLYRHQVELNAAYERFVPIQFLRFLEKESIIDVQLGDHVQTEMSVLFADIRSFTTLSEQMTPEENFNFLNDYLSQMEPVILDNHGFIDKYIGDSIMSLFDRGADDAVRAGIALLYKLGEYNAGREARGEQPIRIGVGVNSGRLMLGTLGGHHRMDSTVISDAVNLASRIEGLTKTYGTRMLISEHTYRQLREPERFLIRIIDRVTVKGKSEPVSIYEVFDADPEALRDGKMQAKSLFEQASTLFHQERFAEALTLFEQCLQMTPDDQATRMYIDRCHRRTTAEPEQSARGEKM